MPYDESQLLPISALQHLLFCERQCALIHIEQVWSENLFTAEGNLLHERAHDGPNESRPGVRIIRGLPVRSLELGLSGQCDVVEFHTQSQGEELILPVEYKRGKPKNHRADEVQLCAQALCLEEMFGRKIAQGALYYGERRRRTEIILNQPLRTLTREAAARLRVLIDSGRTPSAVKDKRCESCSLREPCMPAIFGPHHNTSDWFAKELNANSRETPL
jgi:CRISPR-associated exonuclease Cas4